MKLSKIKVFKAALFGLTLVGVGATTWFITSTIINVYNKNTIINNLKPGNKKTISLNKSFDVPIKLIEHESDEYFFLGAEGLEILNERIKNDLQFGPEIETIKSIRINNLSILGKNVSGQYNPFTQEIEISISRLVSEFKNIPIEEKVELIFPTVFHEYGHHFANTYITSIATNDPRNSKKLYSKFGSKSIHKNIPIVFLEEFEKALHYDDNSISNLLSNDFANISSKKSAKSFYDESNGINIKYNQNGTDFLGINDLALSTKIPFRNKNISIPINSSNYTYLFSIDELITRKLQQITYIDRLNGLSIANNTTTFTGTKFKGGYSPSTMAADISRNKSIEWQKDSNNYIIDDKLQLIDYPYGGAFTSKNGEEIAITSSAENLWKAYYDIVGYEYGISQIFLDNSSVQVDNLKRTTLSSSNFKNIKFTGFLDESKNYKGLLFKDQNGLYKEYKFLKNNYDYKLLSAKIDVLSTERNLKNEKNKFGYTTEYIDVSKINLNEPIKVWNDINNNDTFENYESESLSVAPNRPTTTFRESFVRTFEDGTNEIDIDIKNKNFYEVVNKDNDVFLQIYDAYEKLSQPLPVAEMVGTTNKITFVDNVIMFDTWNYKKKK